MKDFKVRSLISVLGGNTKIVIYNTKDNFYKELWRGVVDDICFSDIPYADETVEHLTVINDEDILQIHLNF